MNNYERLKLAKKLLENSEKEFDNWIKTNDKEAKAQACEKGWGAFAQTLKSIKPNIKKHEDFQIAVEDIARRKPHIRAVYACADNLLHSKCFYDGFGEEEATRNCIRVIKDFVNDVERGEI